MPVTLFTQRNRTLALMALGIAGTLGAESWDARHEAAAVLKDLVSEHQLLAKTLTARLPPPRAASGSQPPTALSAKDAICQTGRTLEHDGGVVVAVAGRAFGLENCKGERLAIASLKEAMSTGRAGVALSREEATRLGLPARTAVAGIVTVEPTSELSAVAVVGSAGSERDRSRHQQARTIISVSVVSMMILGFGLVMLRQQKRELALEQQVELERARQERDAELAKANRMATLAALASGFAHEIGTPLGIISGRIEQLRAATATPTRSQELLTQVAAQIERIGKLIRSFLAFARGDAPMLSLVRAQDLARNTARLVGHRFLASRVRLGLELGGVATATITCEQALFEQVLVNVLANALEASSPGQTVTFEVGQTGDRVFFAVRDEGSGVPASAMQRVTEPFFTTKRTSGGSGLGLTIAKEIVMHHRGELVIRRRAEIEGEGAPGTEVIVSVPRVGDA